MTESESESGSFDTGLQRGMGSDRTGSRRDWDTVGLPQDRTGTQWDRY